mmetsp:Transcript_34515/g.33709  ORF Transcript_34515/g.33709 Transcript_34515/m.33709 type:complete len:82 (+) Transcript_34515:430-675(+)
MNKLDNPNKIFDNAGYGSTFGGGHDFYIANECNTNFTSYSNVGNSYDSGNLVYNSYDAKSYLAGKYNFRVKEIEVFELKQM